MKLIPLTQGKFAQVSDHRYEYLNQFKWSLMRTGKKEYAVHNFWNGKNNLVAMHVIIVNPPDGLETDHLDGNGLNNQDGNLRICTKAENVRNRNKPKMNKYPYKGIQPIGKKWRAIIGHSGRTMHLGMFLTPEEAAKAYDLAASKLFGEYANLNFP